MSQACLIIKYPQPLKSVFKKYTRLVVIEANMTINTLEINGSILQKVDALQQID
tara:strand:- start:809 stop:970 length:162 start_codon:yes stop_codon:yes gene_type:complete